MQTDKQWDLVAIAKGVVIDGSWLYVEKKGRTVKLRLSLRLDAVI